MNKTKKTIKIDINFFSDLLNFISLPIYLKNIMQHAQNKTVRDITKKERKITGIAKKSVLFAVDKILIKKNQKKM